MRLKILSRHLGSSIISAFSIALLALCFLYVLIDLVTRLIDDVVEFGIPWTAVLRYYAAIVPVAIVEYHLAGFALLIAVLAVMGAHARRQELTAMLAAGVPLHRQALPALTVALVVMAGLLATSQWVAPQSERERMSFEAEYLSESVLEYWGIREPVSWSSLEGGWTCHITKFNRVALSGEEAFLLSLAEGREEHIRAKRIFWDPGRRAWILEDGSWAVYQAREGSDGNSAMTEQRITQIEAPLTETPEELFEPSDPPAGFSTSKLPAIIRSGESRNVPVRALRVEFHSRFASAALPVVMVVLAVPLGSQIRRGGRSAAITVAVGLALAYLILFAISLNLGRIGRIEPVWSAWLTNLAFGGVGLVLFRRAPT